MSNNIIRLQVFGSLLSRDSTFKFMTHVWKRAMRGIHITAEVTGMIVDEVRQGAMSTRDGTRGKSQSDLRR